MLQVAFRIASTKARSVISKLRTCLEVVNHRRLDRSFQNLENISSYVDSILKPHMESLPSYVKDTSDFITKIQNLKGIPQNAFLVTLDVTSLYINIPHDDGIKVCDHFMSEGGKSQEATSVISKLRKTR